MSEQDNPPNAEPIQAGDEPNEPAAAISETEALRNERDDLLARLQRVSADYVNYQKRIQRDIAQAREFANEGLVKSLLPVLDDMERAITAACANHAPDDPLLVGVKLVQDKMLKTIADQGVTTIEAQGKPFDPDLHQAMMQEASADVPPQTVLRELQKGYQYKGRTIRPTAVIVSRAQ